MGSRAVPLKVGLKLTSHGTVKDDEQADQHSE